MPTPGERAEYLPPEEDAGLDEKGRHPQSRYDALVARIAAEYDMKAWIARCRAKELHPDLQVQFEELAGVLEFDQGMPKEAAEVRAAEIMFNKFNIL